jgi:hypothetical protein
MEVRAMSNAEGGDPKRSEDFNIVVNGKAKKVNQQVLSFDEVVKLAYPTPPAQGEIVYTATFHNADQDPSNGSLVAGQHVKVRNGTRFDVKHAVRS